MRDSLNVGYCTFKWRMFSSVKAVLVDLSGTIHIDDTQTPGSVAANKRLCESGFHVKYVTNTTKESKRSLLTRLTKIGFDIEPQNVYTSLTAARAVIDKQKLSPLLLVDDRAMEEFQGVGQEPLDSVVIGLAPEKFGYESMNKAFRLVTEGAPLIAIHKARYYKRTDGLALGPGPFVSAIEYATDVKAVIVGKPEKSFFLGAVEEFNIQPHQCVMIGDDARDDVKGAIDAGMNGILVKTGKYRPGDEKYLPASAQVLDSFSSAVDTILGHT